MEQVPDEVLLHILECLGNEKDLARCCQVSWRWYAIGSDCDLWAPLFVRRFGRSPNAERKDQGLIVKMQFMMVLPPLHFFCVPSCVNCGRGSGSGKPQGGEDTAGHRRAQHED
jgi:hypothetical protein